MRRVLQSFAQKRINKNPHFRIEDGGLLKLMNKKIIVALDGMSRDEALRFAKKFSHTVWGFKINDLLFENKKLIRGLKKYGNVFADAKLHDIPNTVGNSVKRLAEAGADIITVHASGGIEMMRAAKQNAGKSKIIAVTVLTSSHKTPHTSKMVARLTKDAVRAGLDGVVCSGFELAALRNKKEIRKKIKIVPGIRPAWYGKKDDQKRITTPSRAFNLGADYLVIGRPITTAKDPVKALMRL